ncbi:hypothetical protein POPTR_012G140067v4 [Populus trichocarpa]|uniref:Uncharacterized protein n=3 Tax=Populus trichocarpa TaxID=3694 RepID=A0ACC0S823_POPTR|nr:hypothetical protein POPTR_012G140067v4 [Populus trichocarpa]KAI9384985.1 hypothetical protein POPTR_012G140067v4 [Populus trichocarpa]KAI9384986.1 hypothetical protein POPTR_012G140067v4 [Populus trichocarpa]
MLSDIINKKLKGYLGQLSSTRLSLGQKQAFTQLLPLSPQEICWYRDSNLKLGGSRPPSPELNAARPTLWVPNPLLVRSLFSCLSHLYLFSNHLAIQTSIKSP